MDISLLVVALSNMSSDKDIIGLKLLIFKYTCFCAPNYNSELILIPWRRGNFNDRIDKPLFFLYQVYPCLKSSLCSNSILWVKVSQFNWFFIKEMPFFHKISILNINLCISDQTILGKSIPNSSNHIDSLHDLNLDGGWTGEIDPFLMTHKVLRIVLIFNNFLFFVLCHFLTICESQVGVWLLKILCQQWLSFEDIDTATKLFLSE